MDLRGGGGASKKKGQRAAVAELAAKHAAEEAAKGLDVLATWASLIGRGMDGPIHVRV